MLLLRLCFPWQCHVFDLAVAITSFVGRLLTGWGEHGGHKNMHRRSRPTYGPHRRQRQWRGGGFSELESGMMLARARPRTTKHARWRIEKIWSHINSSSHRPSIRPSGNVLCWDEFSVFWAQFKLQKSNFIDFCSSDAVALISISLWSHNLLSRNLEVTRWIFAYKLATF